MATFSGNAAGYRVDFVDGKVRVVDIDASNGDTGKQDVTDDVLQFDDRMFELAAAIETRVNTHIEYEQEDPDIAALADGGYVVTWASSGQGERYYLTNIAAQRYDAVGNAVGSEVQVNTTTSYFQAGAAVTALLDGGYLVTWHSGFFTGRLYAQRYDAAGNAAGSEIQIGNAADTKGQPDVTALADGGYIICWEVSGSNPTIHAQRFDVTGNAVGAEMLVSSEGGRSDYEPVIKALADGGCIVVWGSSNQSRQNFDIHAQRYDEAGNKVGGETLVNATRAGDQHAPAVAALTGGGYVIAWGASVSVQCYDAAGNKVGGETSINATTPWGKGAVVTALSDGGYVVAWSSIDEDNGSYGVYTQRFDAAGSKVGAEMRISSMAHPANNVAIETLADGGYLLAWDVLRNDGSNHGVDIFSRRFDENGNAVPTGRFSIAGTAEADVINGGQGDQTLFGLDGDDRMSGGAGNDFLDGGKGGADTLKGGAGDDILDSGYGFYSGSGLYDRLGTSRGGAGNDYLYGGQFQYGGAGDDFLYEGYEMNGGDGNDTLLYGLVLNGGAGDDRLTAGFRSAVVNGGQGDDRLGGGYNGDVIEGGAGKDRLSGHAGKDTLLGGIGDDRLDGGGGVDVLDGGSGDDLLTGGRRKNADVMTGGTGADKFAFGEIRLAFNGGVRPDIITDFSASEGDIILLGPHYFMLSGGVAPGNFAANADGNALDANDYILYETDTGNLYYDADGNGAGVKLQFAVIGNKAALTAADFEVV